MKLTHNCKAQTVCNENQRLLSKLNLDKKAHKQETPLPLSPLFLYY